MVRRLRIGLGLIALGSLLFAGCSTGPSIRTSAEAVSARQAPAQWEDLPGWQQDDLLPAWPAFLASCPALQKKSDWARVCQQAGTVDALNSHAIRQFFERNFTPIRLQNADGSSTGLITGYYEPVLRGSRTRQGPYQTPLYRYPDFWRKSKPSVLPSREQLLVSGVLQGQELVYVDDPVEAAFLQVQGSGRIVLTDGGVMRVGFAGSNEQPYRSFGKWLLESGEITPAQATMQGIKAWAKENPARVEQMLNVNPRYIFFQEALADEYEGPRGALGVPLSAQRSLAVDPAYVPLGAPIFLATTFPLSSEPLQRLMLAQDTGSAIKGGVRADFFWGAGISAGEIAGKMKQSGAMWLLRPK